MKLDIVDLTKEWFDFHVNGPDVPYWRILFFDGLKKWTINIDDFRSDY